MRHYDFIMWYNNKLINIVRKYLNIFTGWNQLRLLNMLLCFIFVFIYFWLRDVLMLALHRQT